MNRNIKRYCIQVRRLLPCSWKTKRFIVRRMREQIELWLEDHPDANYDMISAHFGTPQQIAENYICDQSAVALLSTLRMRRNVFSIIAALLVVVLGFSLAGMGTHNMKANHQNGGFIVVSSDFSDTTLVIDHENLFTEGWYETADGHAIGVIYSNESGS